VACFGGALSFAVAAALTAAGPALLAGTGSTGA
jgi:hypothetical protein